ncbi:MULTISPECIES: GHKL domain-containing protein [Clostridium]|uniref:GHKL domain-containing protein n=1 Tax=Clostridium cibarium TaxID=2762247 RepID=A0ABR8PYE2_9CLOT|nr:MULTISPECIES: GHKL domain-containing protein [Clostridium]MBD7913196.1 GHKL domain-containing protein [Clostridium cibarium]
MINSLIEVIAVLMIYTMLFEEINLKNCSSKLIMAVICIIPHYYLRSLDVYLINLIISIIIIFILFKLLYKIDTYQVIVRLFVSFFFLLIGEAMVGVLLPLLSSYERSYSLPFLLICILSIITMLTKVFIRKYALDIEEKIVENIKMYLLHILNFSLILFLFQYLNDRLNLEGIELGIIFVIALGMILVNMKLINNTTEEIKKRNIQSIENQYNPILEQYFESLKAKEHEYKNHLNIIYTMLEVSDGENTKDLIKDYIKCTNSNDYLTRLMYLDNNILKALIYSKICETEDKEIKFKYEINTNLKNLNIDNSELVIILSNLLNNAIEAAEESERKIVSLTILKENKNDKDTYKFIVENTVKNSTNIDVSNIFIKGYSTKSKDRGFGLYNVQKIIKKVNGSVFIEVNGDIITFGINI